MHRVLAAALTTLLAAGSASAIEQNLITTVAGGGSRATAGPAPTISIYTRSVAVDSDGNLYFADQLSNRVFKVDTDGNLSLVAGNGVAGFAGDGGPAVNASFNAPSHVALDSVGNLFIADVGNARIRRIDASTGVIHTVAGNGTSGFSGDGGPATAARLSYTPGLALDSVGNLFFADYYNQRIRRVDSTSGIITTVAGGVFGSFPTFSGDGGPATNASLNYPSGVTLDFAGNLFIADQSNHRIRRVDASSHVITTVAGNGIGQFWGDSQPATSASLFQPADVAVDSSGNLFIADQRNHRIRSVDALSRIITTVAGNGTAGFAGDGTSALNARLSFPAGIALDAASNLFVWDAGNLRIRRVSAATGIITTVAGNGNLAFSGDGGPATQALLDYPSGLAADGTGNLYIADGHNARIRRVEADTGIITTVAGNGQFGLGGDGGPATSAQLRLDVPTGVAIDTENNLYFADTGNNRIRRIDAGTGIITTVAGGGSALGDGGPATSAKLNLPAGLAVDSAGDLFIADQKNQRVRRVDGVTGIITTVAGGSFFSGLGDGGPATTAYLSRPTGVALDSAGNLFIADQFLNRIRRVDATTGIITTVAGNGFNLDQGGAFTGDGGPAVEASLSEPISVTVDSLGDLFIADGANLRIRRVDAVTGIITTIAGSGFTGLADDGIPALTAFLLPVALALDTRGSLFIADPGSNRIRRMGSLPVGSIPQVSEVSVTKERKHFVCAQEIDLCCADPPFCSCCCIPDQVSTTTVDVDLVTITARVQDPDGPDDPVRVNVAFLDPPSSFGPSGLEGRTIVLDLFDSGPAPVTVPITGYPPYTETVLPGDSIAGDGVFTRKLYFQSSTVQSPGTCRVDTDNANLGGTFSSYVIYPYLPNPDSLVDYSFAVHTTDTQGNGAASPALPLPIQGTSVTRESRQIRACAAPTGHGGCQPGRFNNYPVAAAGADRQSECTSPAGATVTLDGSASTDPDSTPGTNDDITTYQWFEAFGTPSQVLLGTGRMLSVAIGLGTHVVTLKVTDSQGATATDQLNITVLDPAADRDSDGSGDACDNCPDVYNPTQQDADRDLSGNDCDACTDTDGDGFGDPGYPVNSCVIDNCPLSPNPLQQNQDADALGDACDPCPRDPLDDVDRDGVCGDVDSCGTVPNSDQRDTDHDGLGDVCDACTDTDGDGFGDPGFQANTCPPDDCPATPNPLQEDQDGDSLGDVCDPCIDADQDGHGYPLLPNSTCRADNCPAMSNPSQEDRDGDGFGDLCDPCPEDLLNRSGGTAPCRRTIITTFAGGGSLPDTLPALSPGFVPGTVTIDPAGNPILITERVYRLEPSGVLRVLAGNGTSFDYSGDGGLAIRAGLDASDVVSDPNGNLFIADFRNHRVRRVDAVTGIITTVAGDGTRGISFKGDGGPATAASLDSPAGVALDADGNLFIADTGDVTIRRVDAATGIITTVAGNGSRGSQGDGGLAIDAQLNTPTGLAIDPGGDLFIVDHFANRIRRVSAATGIITTVAGTGFNGFYGDSGPATQAALSSPTAVALDASGNLYIADAGNNRIRSVDASTGFITTVIGNGTYAFSGDGGPAGGASVSFPKSLSFDLQGDLYISDSDNFRLRRVDASSGIITTVAGNGESLYLGDGGPATGARLGIFSGGSLTLDSLGNLFIAERGRVRKIDATTRIITTVAGSGNPEFGGDGGPAINAGIDPGPLAVDASDNLYFAEAYHSRIRRVDRATGIITTVAGNGTFGFSGDGGPATSASLNQPSGVAFDPSGNLLIADSGNHRIRRVDSATGLITTFAGDGVGGFAGDEGPAATARLSQPRTLIFDRNGNLFIHDSGNLRIRRIDSVTGHITSVAGGGNLVGDRIPATSAFLDLRGAGLDVGGDPLIIEPHRIRRVDSLTGIITTIAGNGLQGFEGDGGPATGARINFPAGIAVSTSGVLFIGDSVNERVRRVGPANLAPTAVAGGGLTAECTTPAGASVNLDGSASTDPDSAPGTNGDITSFQWFRDFGSATETILGNGATLPVTLPLGTHSVTLKVTDSEGETSTDQIQVAIVDTLPPTLTLTAGPPLLWPPNHRMIPVSVSWQMADRCDPSPSLVLDSVTSSEPDDAPGTSDGSTTGDTSGVDLGTADPSILLRAERSGAGPGRVYELTYRTLDASGNATTQQAIVTVPHDLGAGPEPLTLRVDPDEDAPGRVSIHWNAAAGAQAYDLISGDLSSVVAQVNRLSLGPVTVSALGTTKTFWNEGNGAVTPALGKVFFFALQYRDALGGRGYGAESAPLPREPASCGGPCP